MTIDNHEMHPVVQIEQLDGDWVVNFTVDGNITQRMFEIEQHARNFAAGQRVRLRLSPVADGDDNN